MSRKPTDDTRDDIDRAITRAVRMARIPRDVPAPGPHDVAHDELLRYVEGTASADERRHVDELRARSPYTQAHIEILRDALAETGHAPTISERAVRYVFVMSRGALEFLRGSTSPLSAPPVAWATRRLGSEMVPKPDSFFEFRQSLGKVQAYLKIEHVAASRIDLQLTLEEAERPVTDARITLSRDGQIVESLPIEETGSATLSGLEPARYELEIRKTGGITARLHLDFLN